MPDPNNGAMTGADRINHAVAIAAARRVRPGGAVPVLSHGNPLGDLGEATDAIVRASGLGRAAPARKSAGEEMSDANGPEQDVQIRNGSAVHRKAVNGGVRETPLGAYDGTLAKKVLTPPWRQTRYGDSAGKMRDYSPTAMNANAGIAPLVKPRMRGQFDSGGTLQFSPADPGGPAA